MSSIRTEVAGRVAFGDPSSLSLFFRNNNNNNNNNTHITTNTRDEMTEKLAVASSSLTKGRDAAYEKMMAYGEEWAEEEELEEWSNNSNTNNNTNTNEDDYHRVYQRDTQLAMTRLNKLKIEKRKTKLYR